MAEKYLLAMDGSELSKKAAEKAVTLMKGSVATLDVVVVASDTGIPVGWASDLPNLIMEARMEEARKIVADAQDFFKKKGIEVDPVIKVGHPAQEICKFASAGNYNMVIMGACGRTGLARKILGSTANEVLQCVGLPILIVK